MPRIKVAIVGIGNCASSLVQGISYYASLALANDREMVGLQNPVLGGYSVGDMQIVAAFDIDSRKVGKTLEEAIFAAPNNTTIFHRNVRPTGTIVHMGPILDGCSEHMFDYPEHLRFDPANTAPANVTEILTESGAEVLVNYLPVGSEQATEYYAQACLDAGVAMVNCIPVFVASDPSWARRFRDRGLPIVGDDIKAQVGATITHRNLARLFNDRGVQINCTYQLNTAGNTDFLNMLARDRLSKKKISKTQAVQSQLDVPLPADQIHIGPSDFVPFQKDNKICFLRIEGTGFGGVPLNLELRLSVEDSPNSAGVVVDAIRCAKLALDAGICGPINAPSAWTMKHPPNQMLDSDARLAMEEFVAEAVAQRKSRQPRPSKVSPGSAA